MRELVVNVMSLVFVIVMMSVLVALQALALDGLIDWGFDVDWPYKRYVVISFLSDVVFFGMTTKVTYTND